MEISARHTPYFFRLTIPLRTKIKKNERKGEWDYRLFLK